MCECVKAEQQVPVAAVAAMREPSGSACVESGTTVALTVTDCTISRRDCGRLQIVFDFVALSHFVPHVSQACHFLCGFYAAELPSVPCDFVKDLLAGGLFSLAAMEDKFH